MELDAQLRKILAQGIEVDHINGERHIHLIPGVFELVIAAARRYGIRHIRLIDDVGFQYLNASDLLTVIANGGWLKFALLRSMSWRADKLLQSNDAPRVRYATILFTGKMHQILERIWSAPPAGVTELAVHPGLPNSANSETGNTALTHYLKSADRKAELQACIELKRSPTTAEVTTFTEVYARLSSAEEASHA